jgi:hypothetical protein
MMKHLKTFGVELEGLFRRSARARLFDGKGYIATSPDVVVVENTHGDGSVCGDFFDPGGDRLDVDDDDDDDNEDHNDEEDEDGESCNCRSCRREHNSYSRTRLNRIGYVCREWASPVIHFATCTHWKEVLPEYWPASVNRSCGLHVHYGLTSLRDYARLVDLGFQFTMDFVKEMTREFDTGSYSSWPERGCALSRLAGSNSYCELPHDAKTTLHQFISGDTRYTAVNFAAYQSHGTVEVRVLPAIYHAERGIKLIEHTSQFLNDYLATKGRAFVRLERKPIHMVCEDDMVLTTVGRI